MTRLYPVIERTARNAKRTEAGQDIEARKSLWPSCSAAVLEMIPTHSKMSNRHRDSNV